LKKLDEIIRTDSDKAYLLVSGRNPIEIEKAYQYKLFKGILNEDNKISRFHYRELIDDYQETQEPEAIIEKEETQPEKMNEHGQEKEAMISNINRENTIHPTPQEENPPVFYQTLTNPVKIDDLETFLAIEIKNTDHLIKEYDKKVNEAKKAEKLKQKEEDINIPLPIVDEQFAIPLPEESPFIPNDHDVPVPDDGYFASV
jgi:type IV secretion system protein VirD4